MSQATADAARRALDPAKFRDPEVTAKGEPRAAVPFAGFDTLWFNTGTLCNLTCRNCYIESSPTNDRLAYLEAAEVTRFLDELDGDGRVREIGFTGGEPFMNPDIVAMLGDVLARGLRVLVLTNAMKPMHHKKQTMLALRWRYGAALPLRVSLDHFTQARHEAVRGAATWAPAMAGLRWLAENAFNVAVAGRTCWNEDEETARAGYDALFRSEGIAIDAGDPARMVLFPEMDAGADVPEISVNCWDILGVRPETIMCATSRMVVRKKGAAKPVVVPCTLLPYDPAFEMGTDLAGSAGGVRLNHPHCAKFCVLGGASCSPD